MRVGSRSLDRYLLVGLVNTGLDLALFSLLAVALGVPAVAANVASTVVVMTLSFFLNRAWVFRSEASGPLAYLRFAAITLTTGLVVQSGVIVAVLAAADALAPSLPHAVAAPGAKVVAMGTAMVLNFLGYRWLFSSATSTGPAPRNPDPAAGRRSRAAG
jgi:putative flippase GtrA